MVSVFKDAGAAAEKLHTSLYACVTSEANQNLSPTQKETLRWHFRLGHPPMALLCWLARRNLLGPLSKRIARTQDCPMCGTCQYGKQTRKSEGTTKSTVRPNKIGGVIEGKLEPGDEIAADQFETRQRGQRFNTEGREAAKAIDEYLMNASYLPIKGKGDLIGA